MRIIGQGIVYDSDAHPPDKRSTAFVSLCAQKSGTLLSSFQVGPQKHAPTASIGLSRSRDGGATWVQLAASFSGQWKGVPGSLSGGNVIEVRPGRLMLYATWFDRSDPSRPIFDEISEGVLPTVLLRSFSDDEGDTWSRWEELPTGELRGCSDTGPPVLWSDGTLAVTFESYKEWTDPRPHRHAAWIVISKDGGQTFSQPWLVAQHPEHRVYYWDQRLCALPTPGEFLALFWTHDLHSKHDLPVHLRHSSIHDSKTPPTPMRSTNIPGQIAAPAILEDGRWLAFVVDRSRPNTMKLWVSYDEGCTWPVEDSICIYNHDERANLSTGQHDVDYKQYWGDMLKWTFGHPAILVRDENELLLSFYAGLPCNTNVHCVRVDAGACPKR